VQKLTHRQEMVLQYIQSSITERGYPPTLREIGNFMGIRSTNGVNDHLRALERKGYLTREDMKSRALRPTVLDPKLHGLNGHGANDFRQVIRELQPKTKVFLTTVNWYKIVDPKGHFEDLGDHAGELETSVMMHLAPDAVLPLTEAGEGKERRFRIAALREGWAWAPRDWKQITADTGVGNPKKSTAEKGKNYLEIVVQQLSQYFIELAKVDVGKLYE